MISLRSLALHCLCSGVLLSAAALPPVFAQSQTKTQAQSQTTGVDQTFDRIERLQQEAAARQRAINLARNTVVRLNGGLTRYMPAACMFASAGGGNSCLIRQNSQGFLFRFNGGAPGWQQQNLAPTFSSEVLIAADGRSVLEVIYNGPLR